MPGTLINRGNILYSVLIQVALTPAQTGANTSNEQTFTVPGIQVGDQISAVTFLGANTLLVDIVQGRVTAANTIALNFQNGTGGALTYPAGNFLIEVNRPESLPLPANAA